MSSLAIRCRSCTPASTSELTEWLRKRVERLRSEAPDLLVRLSRLAQDLPDATIDDGWLIELEVPRDRPEALPAPAEELIEEMLRDMRILGLSPSVLGSVVPGT